MVAILSSGSSELIVMTVAADVVASKVLGHLQEQWSLQS